MLDSQNSTLFELIVTWNGDLGDSDYLWTFVFELVGTWNGDLGDSDHLWPDFFGAELSGGVPGAGDSMKNKKLLAMLKHG